MSHVADAVAVVLFVGNDSTVLNLVRSLPDGEQITTESAITSESAYAQARDVQPVLIIIEGGAAQLDEVELCHRLKKDTATAEIPVLLLIAECDMARMIAGFEAGADDCLSINTPTELLRKKIERLVAQSKERHARQEAAAVHRAAPDHTFVRQQSERVEVPAGEAKYSTERWMVEDRLCTADDVLEKGGMNRSVELLRANALTNTLLEQQISERKQAEKACGESDERFRLVVESVRDYAIFLLDAEGQVVSWNAGAELLKGYCGAEIIGQHFSCFYTAEDITYNYPARELRIAAAKDRCEDQGWRVRKDGTRFWADVVITALRDEAGNLRGYSNVTRDVTERKQVEEKHAWLQTAFRKAALEWQLTFDAIESPVLILDLSGMIIRLNHAAKELSGADSYEKVIGRLVERVGPGQPWQKAAEIVRHLRGMLTTNTALLPPSSSPHQTQVHQTPKENSAHVKASTRTAGLVSELRQATSYEVRDQADGKTWDISISLAGGDLQRIILVARDITRRVQLEASLHQSEMMSALGSLVAGVAHEARNPLFAISSVLDAFEARFHDHTEYGRYTGVLREELNRLNELMEELLEYGKPPQQELNADSLEEVIAQAVRLCLPLAERSGVSITNNIGKSHHPHEVVMSRRRLSKVFLNLLKNAVQHSTPGSSVTVDAAETQQDNQTWIDCIIKDTGPGFNQEDLPRIFEPFFTRRRGGTGLGLSIVHRIMDEHGGKIIAGNRPEGGACVVARFPAAHQHREEALARGA